MTSRTLRLSLALGVIALTGFGANARAQFLSISASTSGTATSPANYVNFNEFTPLINGAGNGPDGASVQAKVVSSSGTIGVSFSPDGGFVQNSVTGAFATPFLTGNNDQYFGLADSGGHYATGSDTTTYITSGGSNPNGSPSSATLDFSGFDSANTTGYNYLGLLWGSIDAYNHLTFWGKDTNGNEVVLGTITPGTTSGLSSLAGIQTEGGTAYVNITTQYYFNKVVLTSGNYAFEADNVAFARIAGSSAIPGTVPEPASLVMFGTAFLVVSGVTWKRNRKAKAVPQS